MGLKPIEVLFLPPESTSIIQLLDTGFITEVKCRYHRKQIEHRLELDEMGITNIYKVDQLQKMRWICDSWDELKPGTILNCWPHTKTIGGNSVDIMLSQYITLNYEEEELEQEIVRAVSCRAIRMSISSLTNHPSLLDRVGSPHKFDRIINML